MAKKRRKLKLRAHRQLLLTNCDQLVARFKTSKEVLQVGEASAIAAMKIMSSTNATAAKTQISYFVGSLKASDLLVLVQAGLIQEWHIYLESIFRDVVLHYLEIGTVDALPRQKVEVRKMKCGTLSEMRRSVAEAAKESFSFMPYEQRVKILSKIFRASNTASLDTELKKHVEIRNIFQHNRGKIRQTDLDRIGQTHFEVLDENGRKTKYAKSDEIILTSKEVERLDKIIEQYSEKFEVL